MDIELVDNDAYVMVDRSGDVMGVESIIVVAMGEVDNELKSGKQETAVVEGKFADNMEGCHKEVTSQNKRVHGLES